MFDLKSALAFLFTTLICGQLAQVDWLEWNCTLDNMKWLREGVWELDNRGKRQRDVG
jgi:hypothetical protein